RLRRLDWLPPTPQARWPRAVLGVVVGGLVAASLLVAMSSNSFDPAVARYFRQQSVPAAHGHNVVNVILVDFRALATLGEIVVVFVGFTLMLRLLARLRAFLGRAS